MAPNVLQSGEGMRSSTLIASGSPGRQAGHFWGLPILTTTIEPCRMISKREQRCGKVVFSFISFKGCQTVPTSLICWPSLPTQARRRLKEAGWTKGLDLANLARSDARHFGLCNPIARAREMPKEDFSL